jgi:hypothetical protein
MWSWSREDEILFPLQETKILILRCKVQLITGQEKERVASFIHLKSMKLTQEVYGRTGHSSIKQSVDRAGSLLSRSQWSSGGRLTCRYSNTVQRDRPSGAPLGRGWRRRGPGGDTSGGLMAEDRLAERFKSSFTTMLLHLKRYQTY